MSELNNGGPAYPAPSTPQTDWHGNAVTSGMSLRDRFAIAALGFGFDWVNVHETGGYAEAAQVAYEVADAMIAERSK